MSRSARPGRDDGRLAALTRRAERAERFAATLSRIGAEADTERAVRHLVTSAMEVLDGDEAVAVLVYGGTRERELTVRTDAAGAFVVERDPGPQPPGTFAATMLDGAPAAIIDDFAALDPQQFPLRAALMQRGMRAAVVVPILDGRRRIGSLHVNHRRPGFFPPPALAIAEALAAHAGAVIERTRADLRQAAALARQSAALGAARAEARAVLDATAEAMLLVGPDGCIRLVNRAFAEGFGVEPADVLERDFRAIGSLVARIFADPEGFGRLVAEMAADPTGRSGADVRQRWPWERDLALTSAPVPGADGQALGRLYVFRDVTQEREVTRLREERQQALEAELTRAAQLQADLLPRGAPVLAGFDLAARCLPARAVGGDFFDWHEPVPGVLTLTLGDVMGKGLSAALLMATVRAALEAVARHSPPVQAVEALAAATERALERAGAFVTLFHARADATTRRVAYADAGHGHVFVRRAGGTVEGLPARGLPLGVLPGQRYPAGELTLAPGDALVVYSDGLLDARPDLEETPATLGARLAGATSARAIVERLVTLTESGAPLPDDLTVVALRCRDDAPDVV